MAAKAPGIACTWQAREERSNTGHIATFFRKSNKVRMALNRLEFYVINQIVSYAKRRWSPLTLTVQIDKKEGMERSAQ
jgi:hypothetical protein